MRSRDVGWLKLTVLNENLFKHRPEPLPEGCRISLGSKSISLASLIDSHCLEHDDQRKALLSYILARAVWQFYESDWMSQMWTKHSVRFMQQHTGAEQTWRYVLDHRPYISKRLAVPPNQRNPATAQPTDQSQDNEEPRDGLELSHIYPKILALGILLLEIELGYGIHGRISNHAIGSDYRLRPNADHQMAAEIIQSDKWRKRKTVKTAIRQAIEICIKPDTGKLGQDPRLVREKLLGRVVQPLENLFTTMYTCEGGRPENFDPGPIRLQSLSHDPNDTQRVTESSTQATALHTQNIAKTSIEEVWDLDSEAGSPQLHDWELFGDDTKDLHHLGSVVLV